LTRIPLYAFPQSDQTISFSPRDGDAEQGHDKRECSTFDDPFRHPFEVSAGSGVVLYPLALAGLVFAASNVKERSADDVKKDGGARSDGNLELQWADVAWSLHPDRSSLRDVLDSPPGSLIWNLVATADIRLGDEVRQSRGGSSEARGAYWYSLGFDVAVTPV
jgi:hypothetical protein